MAMLPDNTIEVEGKVYRRKPWKGHSFALVLVGKLDNELDADRKPTGNKVFVPLAKGDASTDPLKSAARKAHKKKQAEAKP
jgi:hypothetical protein